MKRIALTLFTASTLLFACNDSDKKESSKEGGTDTTASNMKPTDDAWVAVDSATEMKNWMESATPGEKHSMLAKLNGTWDAEVTSWMGMGAPATTSHGTITNKMVMDNRYQISDFKGEMMGMPFNGMSTTAYDNLKKKFVSTWIDNMGTGIMMMQGTWDEAAKTLNMTGKMTNPGNGKECEMKETLKIVDDNTHVMEMYGPDSKTGKQYKNMEIKYTRKK